jgi:hypothetical protein
MSERGVGEDSFVATRFYLVVAARRTQQVENLLPRGSGPYSTGSEGIGGRVAWAAARLPTSRVQIASR